MSLIDTAALANMTVEERNAAITNMLAELREAGIPVESKVLSDAAKLVREREAAERKTQSDEEFRVVEAAKGNLEKRINALVTQWITDDKITSADLGVPRIVVKDGKLVEAISLKAKAGAKPQTVGSSGARLASGEGIRFGAIVGKYDGFRVNGDAKLLDGKAVVTALKLPMPGKESAPDAIKRIASGAKVSGGMAVTEAMVKAARAVVIVNGEKIGQPEITMGEFVDSLKSDTATPAPVAPVVA